MTLSAGCLAEGSPGGTASLSAAVLSLTFSGIGCGVLGMPWCFATLGWAGGLAMQGICAGLAAFSMSMLADVREALRASSYPGAVELCLGPSCGLLLGVLIAVANLGAACAAVDFATDFMVSLGELLLGEGAAGSRNFAACCQAAFMAVLAAMSWAEEVTRWRYTSRVSVGALLYVIVAVLAKALAGEEASAAVCVQEPSDAVEAFRWPGIAASCQALALTCFAFSCHFNFFLVVEELEDPTAARARAVGMGAILLMLGIYAAVSASGYAVWKQALLSGPERGNVLGCWGARDAPIAVARGLLLVVLALHGALLVHSARDSLLRTLLGSLPARWRRKLIRWPEEDAGFAIGGVERWLYAATTFGMLALVWLLQAANVVNVLGLVGGVGSITTMLVIPAALFVQEASAPLGACTRAALGGIAFVTAAGSVSVIYSFAQIFG